MKHLIILIALAAMLAGCARKKEELQASVPTEPSPLAFSQKNIPMPRKEVEARGNLSQKAAVNIKQILDDVRAVQGTVTIKLPPKTPIGVIQSLLDIGVTLEKGGPGQDYEIILSKPISPARDQ